MVHGSIRDYSYSLNLGNGILPGRRISVETKTNMNGEIHPVTDEEQSREHQPGWAKRSLGIFLIHSPIRKHIIKIVSPSSYFDSFILAAILLNSILMACVDYRFIDENYQPSADLSLRNNIIEWAEIVFTIIFSVECVLKVIAHGLCCGKRTYLRDGWNVLDFVIVIIR